MGAPDLQGIEVFGDDPAQRRTLKRVGFAASLIVVGGILVGWVYSKHEVMAQRVTKLEAQRESTDERVKRIEDKVDFLIERLIR